MNTLGECRCSSWIMLFTAWELRLLWFNKLWNLTQWQPWWNVGLPSVLIKPRASKAMSTLNYQSIPVASNRGTRSRLSFPPLPAIPRLPQEHHLQHGILDHLWTARTQLRGGSLTGSLWLLKQAEMGMEYLMILILRVQSSFPKTGTNCETGKTPILFRLILLTVAAAGRVLLPSWFGSCLAFFIGFKAVFQ